MQVDLAMSQAFTINVRDNAERTDDLILSANQLQEGSAAGAAIGTFSLGSTSTLVAPITYSLLATSDANSFRIDGARLLSDAVLDYELRVFYNLRVQARDSRNNTVAQNFVIVLNDRNEPPTDISLSNMIFSENLAANTPVGLFTTTDPDVGDTFTYALVSGTGSDNNDQFVIANNQLRNRTAFDFEAVNSYSVRIRSTDPLGSTFERAFTVRIRDVNEAPTNVSFSPSPLSEGEPRGTRVGSFSATDPDAGDTFTYALVAGEGGTHNNQFFIAGNQVFTASELDYEETPTLSIRVRARDQGSLFFERAISIQLQDLNDPHTAVLLSSNTIAENSPTGTEVGTLSVEDSDNSTITYRITESSFSNAFRIEDDMLLSDRVFDFESQPILRLTIEATDEDENSVSETFQINVTDANDVPSGLRLSEEEVDENSEIGTLVGIFSLVDEDGGGESDYTYTFVDGPGSEDNADFQITEFIKLKTARVLDHEQRANRRIRVRALGGMGEEIMRNFTILVRNVNDPPTSVVLSETTVRENQDIGTLIGLLSCEDQDVADAFTYRLQGDVGILPFFEIRDGSLYTRAVFNHEIQDEYSFSIQATDRLGASVSTPVTIQILDDNDPPALQPAMFTVPENSGRDTFIGTVSATDVEPSQRVTYQFYFSPNPEITNSNFYIDAATGNIYVLDPEQLDYETSPTQQIEVQATDDGTPPRSSRKIYTIEIQDVAESFLPAPIVISPNNDGMNDNWTVKNVHLYSDMKLTIFSTLGQVVYSTTNYQNDWKGTFNDKPLPRGVYYYVFTSPDGSVAYQGTISIIK